jgi:ketosteroid isomerase-like protein
MTNDIDKLTALNRDFVASAQNSDVRRFDEILAPEFYCSNPDKSLVDRAAFLEQTAKPVAIKNLQAHDVKIRIMGDFAIIHAAFSYTTPDGQQAHGRYTDCWAKQNGKWLAVSAHVTRRCAAVIAGLDPRLSGSILVDKAHGMDPSAFRAFGRVRDTRRRPRHAASE